jgi:nucleotide-binding universal stress UspA family protein
MSYKTILVHAGVDPHADSRLAAAFALADRFDSTVVGAGAIAWDPYVDPALGYCDGETIQALRDGVDADIADAEARFKKAAAAFRGQAVWRSAVDYPVRTMTGLACGADLIVASYTPKGFDDRRFPPATDLVMESGLPVLLVPAGQEAVQPRNVLVGWKNTRETRRAVTDALPLLKLAEKVHVVQVDQADAPVSQAELDDVVSRLERHTVFAEAFSAPQLEADVSEDLMAIAQSRGCDTVVLGAYGHSRLREWAFGGVTLDLLSAAPKRILFSR